MKTTEHGEHLVALTRLGAVNCYFVREDDGLTLVDTTTAGAAGEITTAIERLGAPLRRIVVTHAHADHHGSVDALHARHPQAEILVSVRDARFWAGDRSSPPGEPKGRIFPPFYTKVATPPTRLLVAGDRVGSLQVISAPGHTPGQVALLDTRDDTLICGDAYLALGGLFVTTQKVARFPVPALIGTWHKPTAYTTAVALRDLRPSRLATGHGPVLHNPGAEMDRALGEAPRS